MVNIKPRSFEQVAGDDHLIHQFLEGVVKTAVIPTHRFVKNGTSDGEYLLGSAGASAAGISVEQMNQGKDSLDDYAVDARIRVLHRSVLPVVVETTGTPAFRTGDDVASDANGKAVQAVTGDFVLGSALGPEFTVDGVKYVRLNLAGRQTKKEA